MFFIIHGGSLFLKIHFKFKAGVLKGVRGVVLSAAHNPISLGRLLFHSLRGAVHISSTLPPLWLWFSFYLKSRSNQKRLALESTLKMYQPPPASVPSNHPHSRSHSPSLAKDSAPAITSSVSLARSGLLSAAYCFPSFHLKKILSDIISHHSVVKNQKVWLTFSETDRKYCWWV